MLLVVCNWIRPLAGSFLHHEETNEVDVSSREALRTYLEVMKFMLTIYATNEVTADAYPNVTSYRHSSGMYLEPSTPSRKRVLGRTAEVILCRELAAHHTV